MGGFPRRIRPTVCLQHDAKHNDAFGTTAFGAYALFWFGVGASWLIQMGVFGDKLAATADSKQLGVAFLGHLIFSLYMTIGAMETHKVLFAIFVLIDLLFVGLALSTWGIMHEVMHQLAAYSELFISLLAFYASAASVLNTHLGRLVLPVGAPSGIFKEIKQDNPDDTFL